MNSNLVLKRVSELSNLTNRQIANVFKKANKKLTSAEVDLWLIPDDSPNHQKLSDEDLSIFLNGLIIHLRGPREDGSIPEPDKKLDNNMIFKKLKIAFEVQTAEIPTMFRSINRRITKNEVASFLRGSQHAQYREMKDQYLRNFLSALKKRAS